MSVVCLKSASVCEESIPRVNGAAAASTEDQSASSSGNSSASSSLSSTSSSEESSASLDTAQKTTTTTGATTIATPTAAKDVSNDELALLAKLEEANRLIESDAKSLNSLQSNHSRKGSDTSQVSLASGCSVTTTTNNNNAAAAAAATSNGNNAVNSSSNNNNTTTGPAGGGSDGEENTWSLWGKIIADWDNQWKKRKDFVKDLIRQGIPHHFRSIVWQLLCGAHESEAKRKFADYMKRTSCFERIIRRDIARTYPEHDFFKEKDGLGQESLFNVMKAYSLYDLEVGYCQGSGFIVGLLLMQQMPEEEAFAVLVALMQDYRLRDMFKPSMAELGVCMYQLEHLVSDTHPELFAHFAVQGFHTSMYASSWFLTLFTTALSLPLACRIFDVFLSEGMEIIFKVALAMLQLGKDDLVSLDMEGMLKFFQKELPGRAESDPNRLMSIAYSMKINQKRMKKLEKDYTVLKMKEQEEMVELRRLRTENRMLRQRTELLEAESAELAEKLVRGQVSRAEEEEIAFVAQRELTALRHVHLETLHGKEELLHQKEELIQCLQDELVRVRLHEAENDAQIYDLRERIRELEQDKKQLRECTPDNSVAHLQEELIAVKLREAEANLSLKDVRQRVSELSASWQKHLQEHRAAHATQPADSTPKKLLFWESRGQEVQKLEEDLMTTRFHEMEALTEAKELRLKVMELETQVQVSTNQLRRQDEHAKVLRDELEQALARQKELETRLREQQDKYCDLESKMKDDTMMARIRDAEHAQQVAELKQQISVLELKNEEMHAEGELRNNMDESDRVRELQDKVAELKAEVLRLESLREHWAKHGDVKSKDAVSRSCSIDTTDTELDALERSDELLKICLKGVEDD